MERRFVESMNQPTTDPLAFWTNGGPGCSGLIGFMTEQGPFRPNADLTLKMNEYAWNQVANMVFIESPAGVGFSYPDNKDDLKTGDAQTALDNYNLIQAFLTRFPEYRGNDLYITSESYGGHYMPTLAKQIVDSNSVAGNTVVNFKGFAVGNPYTDFYSGIPASIDTYWGHQLVPLPTYNEYVKTCRDARKPNFEECELLLVKMMKMIGDLNPYALDYPVCTDSSKHSAQGLWQTNHMLKAMGIKPQAVGLQAPDDYEPCASNYAVTYLNQASVKSALHVKSDLTWDECSYDVRYNATDSERTSTAPIYNYLIDGKFGLNILVYSGDDDSVCGTIGTQSWIWGLGYETAPKPWAVYTYNQQTAGYLTKWTNTKLAFLTVHGAGHEVPAYKPDVALDLFKRYLAGEFTN
ncbi:S10 family peptidase [archaeon]|nr:MAG: S10 family peptidase [archaeon]